MSPLFVNITQVDIGYSIMAADFIHRVNYIFRQFGVRDIIDSGIRIAFSQIVHQSAEGRTEAVKIGFSPVCLLVASNRGLRPTVVRTAKDQENIGITQVVHARYEGTIRIIRFLITGVANG